MKAASPRRKAHLDAFYLLFLLIPLDLPSISRFFQFRGGVPNRRKGVPRLPIPRDFSAPLFFRFAKLESSIAVFEA
jgi:hypothetical protein